MKQMEEKSEAPLWLTALTRAKNKEYAEGKKGDVWVCGLDSKQFWCKETKCFYCDRVCYYIPENSDLVKKNAKKICPVCALEKHSEDLPDDMKKMLERVVEDLHEAK